MVVYLDSSALVKRYINEKGSDRIVEIGREANEIVMSVLCVPEVLSAGNRLKREAKIKLEHYMTIKNELSEDIREATLIDITNEIIQTAIHCLEQNVLRTLDALHIATAIVYKCDLFVTSDSRQEEAALLMGLRVESLT